MIATLEIAPVAVPARWDGEDGEDFRALADVFTRAMAHDLGSDHLRWVAAEALPSWHDQTYVRHEGFLARREDAVVGALQVSAPLEDDATEVEFDLLAAPEARGEGVEEALLDRLYVAASDLGRTVLQTWSLHPIDPAATQLAAPTGFGAIPLDGQARLYRDNGFTLRQVERNSRFDLTADLEPVRRMLDAALTAAGPDYRLVTWTAPTPDEFVEGFAYVLSRMSTDVPTGGMELTEERWDAERVRRRDARLAAGGLTVSIAAVVHVPTGRVVAYNELGTGADRTRPTHQWGTLVAREHRGHRLGTVVKCAGILRWRELVPESPFISTFNAEENRPMLDVNEAIGFTPLAVAGAWQREL